MIVPGFHVEWVFALVNMLRELVVCFVEKELQNPIRNISFA